MRDVGRFGGMKRLWAPMVVVWIIAFAFALAFAGCTAEHGEHPEPIVIDEVEDPVAWGAAKSVVRLRHLWFSDQPDEEGLTVAKREGVVTVIDLRAPEERDWDESAAAERLGLVYRNVVIPAKGPFDAAAFEEIEAILKAHPGEPTLIHCSSGNRAAAWLATHLVNTHSMPFADALAIGRRAGITKTAIEEKVAVYLGERPLADNQAEGAALVGSTAVRESARERAKQIFGALPSVFESDNNPITEAKTRLGRMLYYETRLSKNHDLSCNSCHLLDRYGVDNEPTSPGHRGQRGERNSPTVFNAAMHIAQFWDGRATDVEEQAKGPILNPVEMAMASGGDAVSVLKSIPGYAPLFENAFPGDSDSITYDNVARAIGSFERRLVTPSRFDDFVDGDLAALTDAELAGMDVFVNSGCITCHMGPGFGGQLYQKMGLVHPYPMTDVGRQAVTGNESDKYFFKVPSLRNVDETGPYLHDGSVGDLKEVIRLMGWHQLDRALSESNIGAIATFLSSLTGRIDLEMIAVPKLPPNGPDTVAPDPG